MASQWWEQDEVVDGAPAAPAPASRFPGIIAAPPKQADPRQLQNDAISQANEAARLDLQRRADARATEDQALQRQRFELEKEKATKPSGEDDKGKLRSATLDSVVGQINRVQELYNGGIRDERLTNLWGVLDKFGESADVFDSAGQGMADQALAAFRVPGQGSTSDYEAKQFATANTPQASDYDKRIEEKLLTIRGRVDATRAALGLPPAQWLGLPNDAKPAASNGDKAAVVGASTGAATPPPFVGIDRSAPIDPGSGGGSSGGPGGGAGFQTGAMRQEDDPTLAGVKREYLTRLGRGDTAQDIVKWMREAGINASAFPSAIEQVQFRDKNPGTPIDQYNVDALDDRFVPKNGFSQAIDSFGDGPIGSYFMNAGDAATGFNFDSISPNAALTRAGMAEVSRRNPLTSTIGQFTGGAMAAAGAENALAGLGFSGIKAGLAADAAYGAFAGAGGNDDNRLQGAGIGALAGIGGNFAGRGVSNVLGRAAAGVSDINVNALRANKTPLTIGQAVGNSGIVGKAVRGIEDRASGIPIVGDLVNSRRREGVEAFNRNAFDRALKPIGASIGDKMGEDAVEQAQKAVSDAYTAALAGKAVAADRPFANQMARAVTKVVRIPRLGGEVGDTVQAILEPYMQGGQLTGEAMQQISRELQGLKAAYGADPLIHRIKPAIDEVEDSVFGLFRRQAPEVLPAYNRAKAAYRRLSIVEDAVLKAKNKGGVFTPAQLGQADRSNAKKFDGKRSAAAGKSPFHDFQRSAQEVLPNEVPDSGTTGRQIAAFAIPGVLAGAGSGYAYDDVGVGAGVGAGTTISLAAALALAYSKAGQRELVRAAAGRPAVVRAAGAAIKNASNRIGVIAGGGVSAALPKQ